MSEEVLVKVEGVSKKFCRSLKRSLWYGLQDVGSEMFGRSGGHNQLRKNEFWAVDDVSFDLKRGECLGLIGPNGAGKSTLLKMLNGLVKPDRGRITMHGRVGALIELGAGFNPILTARENIYVNGSVLGFSKKEIDRKFDAIVEFAEIAEFVDTPVQNFSSGMRVRLGFAVAAQMEPDILIIDEVLAVGDVGFRSKCYNAMANLKTDTAVIFVSHSLTHIGRLSSTCLVLHRGSPIFSGQVPEALRIYESLFASPSGPSVRTGDGSITITELSVNCRNNDRPHELQVGSPLNVTLLLESKLDVENFIVDIAFIRSSGDIVAQCNNFVYPYNISARVGELISISIDVPELTLNPGVYAVSAVVQSADMARVHDWLHQFQRITILGTPATAGQQFRATWAHEVYISS